MILIDSDVIIWILRGRVDIRERFTSFARDIETSLFITPVQLSEINAGLKEKERIDTALFLDALPCLDINAAVGNLSGEYLRRYQKSHGVTLADAMIAACAKINNVKVWTLNRKHYPMMGKNDFVG